MVREESSTLVKYSFLRNNRLAIWVVHVNGELVDHAVIDATIDSSNSIATLLRWLYESIDGSTTTSFDLSRVETKDDFGTDNWGQTNLAGDNGLGSTVEEK